MFPGSDTHSRGTIHSEGRGAAAEVDAWLSGGVTRLPFDGGIKKRVSVFLTSVQSYVTIGAMGVLFGLDDGGVCIVC